MCWRDEDRGRILICDGCDQEYHTYCLHSPLAELPDEDGDAPSSAPKSTYRTSQSDANRPAKGKILLLLFMIRPTNEFEVHLQQANPVPVA